MINTLKDAVARLKGLYSAMAHRYLAWSLMLRFQLHKSMEDINSAIRSLRIALVGFERGIRKGPSSGGISVPLSGSDQR
jgi:hypothetical protein